MVLIQVFVGYSGPTGMSIAVGVMRCLRGHKMRPVVAIPSLRDSIVFLESEEEILKSALKCDAAVMICTKKAYYSRKFRDEAETLVCDSKIPVIALVQRGSPVMRILKRRHRIKFDKGRYRRTCKELATVLRDKVRLSRAHAVPEAAPLPLVRTRWH